MTGGTRCLAQLGSCRLLWTFSSRLLKNKSFPGSVLGCRKPCPPITASALPLIDGDEFQSPCHISSYAGRQSACSSFYLLLFSVHCLNLLCPAVSFVCYLSDGRWPFAFDLLADL